MAETTTLLRDLLIVRRGVVQMDDIRKSLRGADEAAEWLVEIGVAVWRDEKKELQALDGMGRPLEKGFRRETSVPQEAPHNREFAIANGGEVQVDPYITMKTAQNTIQSGWLASQADMLAEDWQVVA